MMITMTTAQIAKYLCDKITSHFDAGWESIDIVSGEIQRELNAVNLTPQICNGMRKVKDIFPYQVVLYTPNKGFGTTLKIRYYKNKTIFDAAVRIETIIGRPKSIISSNKLERKLKQLNTINSNIIETNISNFYIEIIEDPNGRYKSWEHCHSFFVKHRKQIDEDTIDLMSLHLAFYLASWGMLRGKSFLLQKDYRVHLPAIKIMLEEKYEMLWNSETESLSNAIELMIDCSKRISDNYCLQKNCRIPSSVLLTKILLGVYGCSPAYDRYLKAGLKQYSLTASFNRKSIGEILDFYDNNNESFEKCRRMISKNGVDYTPMKLIDMFFWEEGVRLSGITHMDALNSDEEITLQKGEK